MAALGGYMEQPSPGFEAHPMPGNQPVSGHLAAAFGSPVTMTGSEGDANSALAELDQGLRCGRLGEQSEAIVRFPSLFAKYPFPILINSALLKLADVFRQGPNFIKLNVLRVIEQSERHLDKITNVDEFVKRLFTVSHSNDPIARALTLRALGSIAVIIPERKQVHHYIRNGLDSHDEAELHAAIFASGKFAAQSKAFATNMCSKISEMICGLETPLDIKLRLIPIFQHMYHDAQTALMVRETCIEMLPKYPSKSFATITLHTLTLLSAHTLVDVPQQVELLLQYLHEDARFDVKKRVIVDLRLLASKSLAHLWSESNILAVVTFALNCKNNDALEGALSILCEVVQHTSIEKLNLKNAQVPILKLCQESCYGTSLRVAVKGTHLLTLIATHCKMETHQVEGSDMSSEAVMAIEALFLLINTGADAEVPTLKECLQCIVMLCKVNPESCEQFVDIVGGMFAKCDGQVLPLLCNLLAALGDIRPGVLKPLLLEICQEMMNVVDREDSKETKAKSITLLSILLFQTMMNHKWTDELKGSIFNSFPALDAWDLYRMGRNAARYGQHFMASTLFRHTAPLSSSEQSYFWIKGLHQIFEGEMVLNNPDDSDLVRRISNGNKHLLLGSTSIKAATSQFKTQDFQINYVKCRSETLQALLRLVYACNSLRTSPPPAIASSQAKQSKDDLQRCGRITQIVRQCVKDFNGVAKMYGDLYQGSFDADPDTLLHLQLLQQLNSSIAQWLEMVCLKGNLQGALYQDVVITFIPSLKTPIEDCNIGIQALCKLGEDVASCFREVSPQIMPISDVHTASLHKAIGVLASTAIPYPRFFFQSLQQTSLKMAVTPQAKVAGEPVGVSASQQFAIKVEGVITNNNTGCKSWRQVDSVLVTLSSVLVNPAKNQPNHDARKIADCSQTLEEITIPHNDFFTAQFLIQFPIAGSHQVVIDTHFRDNDHRLWRTGQKVTLNIKAFEDNQNRTGGRLR